jgi:hypothetical protein
MAKKREVRCQEFDVNTCTIIHASKGDKKKHDHEYHSENSAVGSREGFYNVVITRDFSKTPPYYYCTGLGCKNKDKSTPFHERPYSKVQIHSWTAAPSTTESTLASPQLVPTASPPPSNSHHRTGATKRKAAEMASSAPSSTSPPVEVKDTASLKITKMQLSGFRRAMSKTTPSPSTHLERCVTTG